jgi:drug/metabolite transporter (DMT)-like permease
MNTTTSASSSQSSGYLIALAGTVLWSTTAIFIRYLTEHQMPPLVLAFWRDVLVAAALFVALSISRPGFLRPLQPHLPFFILYGLVLMAFNATWTVSVALNGAAVSTVLAYSSPAITALIGWRLWREPLGPIKVAAVLLSLVGCVFVSGAHDPDVWDLNPAGIIVGLISGLMFAAYSIFGKESSRRGVNTWSALMVTFAFAAFFFILLIQLPLGNWMPVLGRIGSGRDLFWLGRDLTGWAILIILAWGPTIGGYGLYTLSLSYLPASVANLIASLEPTLTAALAFLFLGERLTPTQLIGAAMVLTGVVLLRVDSLRQERAPK